MIFDEPLFEPMARKWRFDKGMQFIDKKKDIILVDLGCGPNIRFYQYAKNHGVKFKKYIGIDPLINKTIIDRYSNDKRISLIKKSLNKNIPLNDSIADYIVGFAFLEHIDNPRFIIKESLRIMKKKGKGIFTTPSPRSKLILEILSRFNLISKREIDEHKNYFDRQSLTDLIVEEGKTKHLHSYFHPWLNNLFVVQK